MLKALFKNMNNIKVNLSTESAPNFSSRLPELNKNPEYYIEIIASQIKTIGNKKENRFNHKNYNEIN